MSMSIKEYELNYVSVLSQSRDTAAAVLACCFALWHCLLKMSYIIWQFLVQILIYYSFQLALCVACISQLTICVFNILSIAQRKEDRIYSLLNSANSQCV